MFENNRPDSHRGHRLLEAPSHAYPQTRSAVSTTNLSLAHCSSSVNRLPFMVEAKPH